MNLMVNPTITGFRQDVDGTIKELKLGEAKEDAYANIIEQGSSDLENNKAATINVSTYTQPVEVTPTSGKDGMKKVTITLSNIPSGDAPNMLFAWKHESSEPVYTAIENPGVGDKCFASGEGMYYAEITEVGEGYIKTNVATYNRSVADDVDLNAE